MEPINSIRNIGIFAHVDAGKTTTTEQMLYLSGKIRFLGSVDEGTAQTDHLDVERERGISVRAAVTRLTWNDTQFNLVDTPGHADFLSEVERSLRVMDGAVLIVSAVEGVQAQTEVIWQALMDLNIPTLIYVNKLDRIGADAASVVGEIRKLLSPGCVPIQAPIGTEGEFQGSVSLFASGGGLDALGGSFLELLMEAIAECDDSMLDTYVELGSLPANDMRTVMKGQVRGLRMYPVLFGASGKGIGVKELMDAVVEWLPPPSVMPDASVSGVVFKLEQNDSMGRIAYVRLYNGIIRNRDSVVNFTRGTEEKITQIRKISGGKYEDAGVLEAGDIAAVCGLSNAKIGDILGDPHSVPGERRLAVPLLTVQAQWRNEAEYPAVVAALQQLADEDPLLDLQWLQEERELHLKVMGPIQIEVLAHILSSRFGLEVTFGAPTVIYKETPLHPGEGFVAYTMPKPCWAILRFRIEPGEPGSGVRYSSVVRPEHLLESYQNEVARRVPEALQQGLFGWEVTDLNITLIEGEHHVWHTHPLDFAVATPMGIMNGLVNTGTKLLEPILRFRLSTPEEFGGKIMSELSAMRAQFNTPSLRNGRMELEGELPVATSLDFPARLGSMTKGRGTLTTFFAGYQPCPPDVKAVRQRRGVNPLDTSKYILSVRNALSRLS